MALSTLPRPGAGTVDLCGRRFVIVFPYAPAQVRAVRELPGRRYDRETRTWSCPAMSHVVEPLRGFAGAHGFTISPAAQEKLAHLERRGERNREQRRQRLQRLTFPPEALDRAMGRLAERERRDYWRRKRDTSHYVGQTTS